jgi:probable HAF family extracellular repeat protein
MRNVGLWTLLALAIGCGSSSSRIPPTNDGTGASSATRPGARYDARPVTVNGHESTFPIAIRNGRLLGAFTSSGSLQSYVYDIPSGTASVVDGMATALNGTGSIAGVRRSALSACTWSGWERSIQGAETEVNAPENAATNCQFENGVVKSLDDSGFLAGAWTVSGGWTHAVVYDGAWHDIGTVGTHSAGIAVNNRHEVVGDTTDPGQLPRAFIWRAGTSIDLGTLGGRSSEPAAINDLGQVTGVSELPNGLWHAFLYEQGALKDLGVLSGKNMSIARGINNLGQIVGVSLVYLATDPSYTPFLYENGKLINLNDVTVFGDVGTQLSDAVGIDDFGNIAAYALSGATARAYLLVPRY